MSVADRPPRVSLAPHALSEAELIAQFATDAQRGLTTAEVQQRQSRQGFNELSSAAPVPMWRRFVGQFHGLVIWILIAAAVISGVLGEWPDTLAILAIVVLNAVLGFFQEERAERALAALQKLSPPMAKAIRDGHLQTINARELVPGDRIEIEAGDNIPADARLLDAFALRVQEAALTGESVPVEKDARLQLPADAPVGDRRNMMFMGTVVAAGKASAVVVGTGMQTELGQIAGLLQSGEREPTPLQRRLDELGRTLVTACLAIVAVIFALQLFRGGNWLEVLLLAVSLAVAAVPEGLPAVVTVTLALGLQRMVKRNALVRKLPSVETLGAVTVICSDKTGTLTRNEMTVRQIWAGRKRFAVTGTGYLPQGEFRLGDEAGAAVNVAQESELRQTLTIGALCNNATISPRADNPGLWQVIGDPTEGALVVAAMKAEIESRSAERAADWKLVYEIPFDSDRKLMSVVLRDRAGNETMFVKGAPEMLLQRCVAWDVNGEQRPLAEADRRVILEENARLAADALRVLALAYRSISPDETEPAAEDRFVLAGLVGMMDPPREEVRAAVARCHAAGIRPVMITGDHPATALAIARELQIAGPASRVLTGSELDRCSEQELVNIVEDVAVFARVSAEHKLRVVRAWKQRGQIVAMTGDGVNDAPAVRAADIGIVMGVTGTDVAKEASDMVLTDDNFASIVNAVEEGRGIFDNIRKFLHFLLSSNTSEVLFMFFAALLGWPTPLLPIQILWINLVTDSFPALALAMEPPERDIMQRAPRPANEPVITWQRGVQMFTHGALMATASMCAFWFTYQGDPQRLPTARTVAFSVLTFSQIAYSLGCRSQRYTMPQLGLFSNPHIFAAMMISALLQLSVITLPFAQPIFDVATGLTWEWGLVIVLSLTPVTIIEVAKLLRLSRR